LARTLVAICAQDQAAATSGDYMHTFTTDAHHHIYDPITGGEQPVMASATVVSSTVSHADALATAVIGLGPNDVTQLFKRTPRCESYLVTKETITIMTTGFQA
ncbi:MAG: FAD:protein FMN transferase, partial [Anaerolineales bacterium]|nr:FAD:protein FMN transferase [Anaerolineales bacterium]